MTPERHQRISDLYHAAHDLKGEERERFLATACGADTDLLAEVKSLLALDDQASRFIEEPAMEVAAEMVTATQKLVAVGRKIGAYEILGPLGAGGMGEVYLARDSRLGRKVAIKILPARYALDRERLLRFEQEARTASSLNHPNILTIHEFGLDGDTHYLATELVDGETLRNRLKREPVNMSEVIDILLQTSMALTAAHEAGIVHRDIKPENLMIRNDGIVKVLDFGLAKFLESQHDDSSSDPSSGLTKAGTVIGTVAYLSPEQVRGWSIDGRSDIFSLGVLAYEMLAGKQPFLGPTTSHIMVSILETLPQPLPSSIPVSIQQLVNRALEKRPEDRFQNLSEVIAQLKAIQREVASSGEADEIKQNSVSSLAGINSGNPSRLGGLRAWVLVAIVAIALLFSGMLAWRFWPVNASPIESIAVLPFVDETGDPELEFVSDGMTDTLIDSLSELPNLSVKARSSVFRYKKNLSDLSKIIQDLKVQAALTGRMVRHGDQIQLSLELVDKNENSLWRVKFIRPRTQLLDLQREVGVDVSTKLRSRLSGIQKAKMASAIPSNNEAFVLYLQGNSFLNKRDSQGNRLAISCFEKAVSLDPGYALAYAGLGNANLILAITGAAPADEALPRARGYIEKALALDDKLAEAHATLGVIKFFQDYDMPAYEAEVNRAIELNPNYADGHRRNGLRLLLVGRYDEAHSALEKALALDPFSAPVNRNYAECLLYSGKAQEAEDWARKTAELQSDYWVAYYIIFNVNRLENKGSKAAEALAKAYQYKGNGQTADLIRKSYAAGGWSGMTKELTRPESAPRLSSYDLASFYVELGKFDEAFVALNRAIEKREQFVSYLKIDPFMRPLSKDPRFDQMLKRIGLQS